MPFLEVGDIRVMQDLERQCYRTVRVAGLNSTHVAWCYTDESRIYIDTIPEFLQFSTTVEVMMARSARPRDTIELRSGQVWYSHAASNADVEDQAARVLKVTEGRVKVRWLSNDSEDWMELERFVQDFQSVPRRHARIMPDPGLDIDDDDPIPPR